MKGIIKLGAFRLIRLTTTRRIPRNLYEYWNLNVPGCSLGVLFWVY
jgi:hypothetical protein